MKQIMIIAGREFSVRMKSKSAIISTIVVVLVVLIAGGLANYFHLSEADTEKIGVTTQTQSYAPAFEPKANPFLNTASPMGPMYKVKGYADDQELEQAVQNKEISLGIGGTADKPVVFSDGPASPTAMLMINATAQSAMLSSYIGNLGGSFQEIRQKMQQVQVEVRDISESEASGDDFNFAAYLVVMVLITLLFGTVMASGQLVASGVVEEKSSRIVEILVSTVTPKQLLIGKILGITLLGALQIVIMGSAGLVALLISGLTRGIRIDLASFSGWYIVWFILGLATYMVLFAGAGALASRQEDVGQSTLPLILLQLGGFYAAIFSVLTPGNVFIKVISLIPFLNCYAMPARQLASSTVEWWEPWLSMLINLAILPILIWLGARLYRRGILATGERLKLKDALRRDAVS